MTTGRINQVYTPPRESGRDAETEAARASISVPFRPLSGNPNGWFEARAETRCVRNRAAAHRAPPSAATREGELTCDSVRRGWRGAEVSTRGSRAELRSPGPGTEIRYRYAKYGFSSLQDTLPQRRWRISLACSAAANDARR